MLEVQIKLDDAIARANELLAGFPREAPRVLASVLNRVLEGVRTDATRATTEKYHTNAGRLHETFSLKHASAQSLGAKLVSRGRRLNISDYNVAPRTLRRNVDISGAVMKRGGLKTLGKAFFIRRGSQYRLYIRTSKGRWDIEPIVSPSMPQIVKNEETVKNVQTLATQRFQKRLNHELLRLLGVFK